MYNLGAARHTLRNSTPTSGKSTSQTNIISPKLTKDPCFTWKRSRASSTDLVVHAGNTLFLLLDQLFKCKLAKKRKESWWIVNEKQAKTSTSSGVTFVRETGEDAHQPMKRSKENNLHARPLQVQERNTNLQKHNGNEQKKKKERNTPEEHAYFSDQLLHCCTGKNLQGKIKKGKFCKEK